MRYILLLMLLLPACAGRTVIVEKPVEKQPQTLEEKLKAAMPLLHDCEENCRQISLDKRATVCGTVALGYACMCLPLEDKYKKKNSDILEVRK